MTTEMSAHQLVTTAGEAAGRLNGVNHIQLIVDDMNESVRFYRDILGLRLVRTRTGANYPDLAKSRGFNIEKNYFFDMGNGSLLSLIQIMNATGSASDTEPAISGPWLWPDSPAARKPRKMDHLAFDVETHDDVVWFRQHLLRNDVKVTDIITRDDELFVESIYFFDPNGTPLEIASFDRGNPKWEGFDPNLWFWDEDPVSALQAR